MKETITPGKGVGKLGLGMPVVEALRLRGKPQSTEWVALSTKNNPKPVPTALLELLWWEGGTADDPESWLVALVKGERVVQLSVMGANYRLANGLSTTSDFTRIRTAYPKLQLHESYFGSEAEPGYLGFCFDEQVLGVAFTKGTQDDVGLYSALPKLTPESIVVHLPGQRVQLVEHGLVGLEAPEKQWREPTKRMAAWLKGGPHKPLTS
jgi:hypothetical protein